MERVVKVDGFGTVTIDGIIVYSVFNDAIGLRIPKEDISFKKIKPKYYKWLEDNSVVEIWYKKTGIMIEKGLGRIQIGKIKTDWNIDSSAIVDITDEYNQNKRREKGIEWNIGSLRDNLCLEIPAPTKANNNGGASDWYTLPKNANTLQDLIEHRNMNGSVKDIFKACYRLGIKTEDELRDLNKMAYYSLREIGRITGRKDYITIAKELIGSQTIEKE